MEIRLDNIDKIYDGLSQDYKDGVDEGLKVALWILREGIPNKKIEPDYKKGFEILIEFFDFIPNLDKEIIHKKLEKIGL